MFYKFHELKFKKKTVIYTLPLNVKNNEMPI